MILEMIFRFELISHIHPYSKEHCCKHVSNIVAATVWVAKFRMDFEKCPLQNILLTKYQQKSLLARSANAEYDLLGSCYQFRLGLIMRVSS